MKDNNRDQVLFKKQNKSSIDLIPDFKQLKLLVQQNSSIRTSTTLSDKKNSILINNQKPFEDTLKNFDNNYEGNPYFKKIL